MTDQSTNIDVKAAAGRAMAAAQGQQKSEGVDTSKLTPDQKTALGKQNVESMLQGKTLVSPEQQYQRDVAAVVEQNVEDMSFGDKVLDKTGDVGRATFFGPLADGIAAKIVQAQFNGSIPKFVVPFLGGDKSSHGTDPDMTYQEALGAIRERNEQTGSISADIVGAVLGGGALLSGAKIVGRQAVAKAPNAAKALTNNAIAGGLAKWAAKDKLVQRAATAATLGGSAAMAEEGIRAASREYVDTTAGYGWDGDEIKGAMINGALIGFIGTPAAQELLRGSGGLVRYIRGAWGADDAQATQAAQRIIRAIANDGEAPDDTVNRLQAKVQQFRMNNGEMPALADILKPEQVRELASVTRYVNGLDIRARDLGEQGVARALRRFNNEIMRPGRGSSVEQIEVSLRDVFDDVMQRHGKTMVVVDEEVIDTLGRNRAWLEKVSKNQIEGSGANRVLRVVRAKQDIKGMSERLQRLKEMKNTADARQEIAELDLELERLIQSELGDAAVPKSQKGALADLIRLKKKIEGRMTSTSNARAATFNLDEFRPLLENARTILDDFDRNGLGISLSDANSLRATASRHAYDQRSDPMDADTARAIRDSIANVGREEVPEYGAAVQSWALGMTRAEAQATGRALASESLDMDDLVVRVQRGRLPNKPFKEGAENTAAVQKGIDEGARREMSATVEGNVPKAISMARRIAGSENVQKGLDSAVKNSRNIQRSAKEVIDTYESMKQLVSPNSPTQIQEEMNAARDMATSLAFGNLGGAGRAALATRILMNFKIPRGTSRKIVDMLGDPNEIDNALQYMQRKGIRLGPFFAAVATTADRWGTGE